MMKTHSNQVKKKIIETVTYSKSAAIKPELYCKIAPMYKCCWHSVPAKIKPKHWPVQNSRKCKGDETGDICAADMKQISIFSK